MTDSAMLSPMMGRSKGMQGGGGGIVESEGFRTLIEHLERRSRGYVVVFALGVVLGFPVAEELIEWLIGAEGFVPDGVQLIILQPLEAILLQLRIAVQIGFILLALVIIADIAMKGDFEAAGEIRRNMNITRLAFSAAASAVLGVMGIAYAHEVLIPFLLQYLAEDAAASNLESTWSLQSWVGFVSGLYFSSLVGFQAPLVVILLIRADLIDRRLIVENRGVLWFIGLAIGALLSPPDPVSMFLVGGPILVLMEMALIYDRVWTGS